MPLQAGTKLGPYEILAPVGSELYKASDTRVGREVAIKVSAAPFSERFERDAKAIAALNHPHICAVHDIGLVFHRENTVYAQPFNLKKLALISRCLPTAFWSTTKAPTPRPRAALIPTPASGS